MVKKHIKKEQREKKITSTSDIEIKPLYTEKDLSSQPTRRLGRPAEYPYTRGIHPQMYRSRLWTMRQYSGFGSAEDTNRRFKYLLKNGTTGLSVAFDLPTQMGRDCDHQLAQGEVGRVGVSISSLEDMETLLADIPLDAVSISMTINATASILLAFLLVVAERRGVPWSKLQGTVQNDILKEYIARGTYIFPARPALSLVTDLFEFCSEHVPQWNTISISGYHIREAGSSAVEEMAFTLSDAITYVEQAVQRGLDVDLFAPRLAFFFNCHNTFFEEVAKFRALRRMWAQIMKQRFKAKDPRSMALRFHTQTAGSSLTAQQPMNNVMRTTLQALAAVLGGTQSLHTNAFDEALALPSEESALLALRTQQVIAHETGVTATVDPLGGSYFIEKLTDELESEAWKRIKHTDSLGGMLRAIELGYPQGEIEKSAYRYQQSIERGEQLIVGVNSFTQKESTRVNRLKIDPKGEKSSQQRLKRLKQKRDAKSLSKALESIRLNVDGVENMFPLILSAVRANATLGEISDALRASLGVFQA